MSAEHRNAGSGQPTVTEADRACAREVWEWLPHQSATIYGARCAAAGRAEGRKAANEDVAKLCGELSATGKAIARIIRALPTGGDDADRRG